MKEIKIKIPDAAYNACLELKSPEDDGLLGFCLINAVANGTIVSSRPEPGRAYQCDPEKNTDCKKTGCYERGGPCKLTLNPEYAKEEHNGTY